MVKLGVVYYCSRKILRINHQWVRCEWVLEIYYHGLWINIVYKWGGLIYHINVYRLIII